MNLYLRFFNDEIIATNVDDAISFLNNVTNGQIDPQIYDQLSEYANNTIPYPRRFKVRARTYFIVIKTLATTMEEFKARGMQIQQKDSAEDITCETESLATSVYSNVDEGRAKQPYDAYRPGWYEAEIQFKRVLFNEAKGKNEYVDTAFAARLKAHSVKEAYDIVCSHILGRDDIDSRSQMPSIKGRNFSCKYLGMKLD